VNTTYHGDHTFGNASFPTEVTVVSSVVNKREMTDLGFEKRIRGGNMYGDERLLDAITQWRTPDVVFEHYAEIDLGGRVVQLWHFGPGNGPGDTVSTSPQPAWPGPATSSATRESRTCCCKAGRNPIWHRYAE